MTTQATPRQRAGTPGLPPSRALRIASAAALVFGVMTVFSGGSVLFGPEHVRAEAGAVVPFVLWFNFLAGFAYIAAAVGLWRGASWARGLSMGILGATALVAVGFLVHVMTGGDFASRTVGALVLRMGFWGVIVGLLVRTGKAAR